MRPRGSGLQKTSEFYEEFHNSFTVTIIFQKICCKCPRCHASQRIWISETFRNSQSKFRELLRQNLQHNFRNFLKFGLQWRVGFSSKGYDRDDEWFRANFLASSSAVWILVGSGPGKFRKNVFLENNASSDWIVRHEAAWHYTHDSKMKTSRSQRKVEINRVSYACDDSAHRSATKCESTRSQR